MGSLGTGELFILVFLAVALYGTIAGVVRAFRNGDTGWGWGIIASWVVGLGWVVGWIYLLSVGKNKAPADRLPDPPPPPAPPEVDV